MTVEEQEWSDYMDTVGNYKPRWRPEISGPGPRAKDIPGTPEYEMARLMPVEPGNSLFDDEARDGKERSPSLESVETRAETYDVVDKPSFWLWKRAELYRDESYYLEIILKLLRHLEPVVQPVAAMPQVRCHNWDSPEDLNPRSTICIAYAEHSIDGLFLRVEDEAIRKYEGHAPAVDFLRNTIEAMLKVQCPQGATRPPMWYKIEFPATRARLLDADKYESSTVFRARSLIDDGILKLPMKIDENEIWVSGPVSDDEIAVPIGLYAERFRDVVALEVSLLFSPWRAKSTPEYKAITAAVQAAILDGYRLDQRQENFFELDQ